ncbi:MAG: glycoside hydrolase family 1 protein [Ktedonobacterales bacterium]
MSPSPLPEPADQVQPLAYPEGFLWGAATSSYQYEGANTNNQWYAWEQSGHIKTGDSCGLAGDWWAHAERDFDAAEAMGLNALRLSLEWSRIEPHMDVWDSQAIIRYRQMLQALRDRHILPLVTLHHFTDPLWFAERGGFLAPDAVARFTAYATYVTEELGDLCDFWCTINEPNVYAVAGYLTGDFPPGHRGDVAAAIRVQGAMARAHAQAYQAIHRLLPEARVGWAQHFMIFDPAKPSSSLDRLIARLQDWGFNDFFPRAVRTGAGALPLGLLTGDLRALRGSCDYVGINVYYRDLVTFDPGHPSELFGRRSIAAGAPEGDPPVEGVLGEIYPAGIARIAKRVATDLGKPIYVTENGVADRADRLRPWELTMALRSVHQAISQGIDVRGYFHWSLVDNFEWAEGWRQRFGLIELDLESQERRPRRSAALYAAVAHANALTPEMVREYAPSALATVPSLSWPAAN